MPSSIAVHYSLEVDSCIDDILNKKRHKKLSYFGNIFSKYWMSALSFIYSWNIHHHTSNTDSSRETNNGLARYNITEKNFFKNVTSSLINLFNNLEPESINQTYPRSLVNILMHHFATILKNSDYCSACLYVNVP